MDEPKFGIFLPFYAFQNKSAGVTFTAIRDVVLEGERLGYDSVWLDDHLMCGDWSVMESWTTLSAFAALTKRVRLGTMVLSMSHRNPSLSAKAAATIDVISGGRLEVGFGAGVGRVENEAYGFKYPRLAVRVERLAEAVELTKRLWTGDKVTFQGRHYRLRDAVCLPKPLQKPHPPVIIGGSSGQLLKKVTARYADRIDFGYLPFEKYREKLGILATACKAVDRDFAEVEKSCWPGGQVIIATSEKELEQKIAKMNVMHLSPEEFRKINLMGTPEQVREQLNRWLDLGVTYFMLYFGDLPDTGGLHLFAEEVMKPMKAF